METVRKQYGNYGPDMGSLGRKLVLRRFLDFIMNVVIEPRIQDVEAFPHDPFYSLLPVPLFYKF